MRRLALLLSVSLLAACAGEATTTTEDPSTTSTDVTADEGTTSSLTLYSGRSEELVGPVIAAFEDETGIDVDVRYAGSGELATTILEEGDRSPADVYYAQDPAFAGALSEAGALAELPADILALVPDRYSDPDGRWVGVTARARVLVMNPDLVPEPPSSVFDLTDPAWAGRLGVAPTNASFIAFVAGMLVTEGEERTREWLEGIAANDPVIFDGNSPIVAATDAGDVAAGLVNHYYLLRLEAEQGSATAVNHVFAPGDPGALVLPTAAGVLASSENEEAALSLVRFLLSPESQEYFLEEVFEYPLVEGIGTPAGQPPLTDLSGPDVDLGAMAEELDRATTLISEAGLT